MRSQEASAAATAGPSRARGKVVKKAAESSDGRRFQQELRSMMYGFGDDRKPLKLSVHLMEELVVDYVYSVLSQAQGACEQRQRGARGGGARQVKERDLLFAFRKDRRRQERVRELLEVWKEVKAARGNPADLEKD